MIVDIEKQYETRVQYNDRKSVEIVEEVFQTLYQKFNEAKVEIAPYLASLQARYVFHNTTSFKEKSRAIEIIKIQPNLVTFKSMIYMAHVRI